MIVLLVPFIALLPDITLPLFKRTFFPNQVDKCMYMQEEERKEYAKNHPTNKTYDARQVGESTPNTAGKTYSTYIYIYI